MNCRFQPRKALRKKHQPQRSFKELAQDLGVTFAKLRGHLAKVGAPKPELVTESAVYYEVESFMVWWKREVV